MQELYIDIQPADECWREQYGEDATRVKVKEGTHFGILILSAENARILRAAPALYKALCAYHDMMTPSDEADKLARKALEMAEGESRPMPRILDAAIAEERAEPSDDAMEAAKAWLDRSVAHPENTTIKLADFLQSFAAERERKLAERCADAAEAFYRKDCGGCGEFEQWPCRVMPKDARAANCSHVQDLRAAIMGELK